MSEICCSSARYACAHSCRSGSCRNRTLAASSMSARASWSPRDVSSSLSDRLNPMALVTIPSVYARRAAGWRDRRAAADGVAVDAGGAVRRGCTRCDADARRAAARVAMAPTTCLVV